MQIETAVSGKRAVARDVTEKVRCGMFGKIRIRKWERGLWFKHGDFAGLLAPGVHRIWGKFFKPAVHAVDIVNVLETKFEHPLLELMLADERLREALEVLDLKDHQRGLLWKDGRLAGIFGPGLHAFWREPFKLEVEVFDVNAFRFKHEKLETIVAFPGTSKWFVGVDVADHEQVLLQRDGEIVDTLGKGPHVFWRGAGDVKFKAVDLREQTLDVAGQEIMTRDKVTLRVNLLVTFRVTDTFVAITAVDDYKQALYREAQLVLRGAIGTRTLDDLLADKESVGGEVRNVLAGRAGEFGLEVRSVGLKDIILPGEMKTILNQVIEAEKAAQANLIKRREETAAARSQANTAKLLAESPALARIKELELLGEILAGKDVRFTFGGGEMIGELRKLVARDDANQ